MRGWELGFLGNEGLSALWLKDPLRPLRNIYLRGRRAPDLSISGPTLE